MANFACDSNCDEQELSDGTMLHYTLKVEETGGVTGNQLHHIARWVHYPGGEPAHGPRVKELASIIKGNNGPA